MSANVAERIKLFRTVRDIPYRIGLAPGDTDYCCATKTPLLQKLLGTAGLRSRRVYCRFLWQDTELPRAVFKKAPEPEAGHEFLEVFIPEKKKWVAVDPTWDSGAKTVGLPIASWNGLGATALAVKPIKIFSPKESAAVFAQIDKTPPRVWANFLKQNRAFFSAINDWLERNRA